MTRKLDKTKKSNIKCEHCQFFDKREPIPVNHINYVKYQAYCPKGNRYINYWNRCKDFEWHERYNNATTDKP